MYLFSACLTFLLINLYAKRNFTAVNHSDVTRQAVLSPTAIIQVKMLTRGGVAVELRWEKSFPRWGLARNIGWGCGGLKILPHRLWWVCEKPPELYCRILIQSQSIYINFKTLDFYLKTGRKMLQIHTGSRLIIQAQIFVASDVLNFFHCLKEQNRAWYNKKYQALFTFKVKKNASLFVIDSICNWYNKGFHLFRQYTINRKWVWSGNTTITNRRQPHGTVRKSHSTIMRHQEDKPSKATSSLFPIKMILVLEWT